MTLQEKLREWIREADYIFEQRNKEFIAGVKQGLSDALELLTEENIDKEI